VGDPVEAPALRALARAARRAIVIVRLEPGDIELDAQGRPARVRTPSGGAAPELPQPIVLDLSADG
jgi:hypothetical protein